MKNNKPKFQVVTSTEDKDVQAIHARKLLLAGEAIFASFGATTPQGFAAQLPRDATAGILAQFSKDAPKIHVAVDEKLFSIKKIRVAFAIDGYLNWGLRQRSKVPVILFGGGELENSVNIGVMVFHKNRLVELREKSLPPIGAMYFHDALAAMLSELRAAYPTARFVQSAPLSDWAVKDVEYIGDKAIKSLSYRPLSRASYDRSNYLIPAAITALALFIYPALAMSSWNDYNAAIEAYDTAIADPAIQSKEGMDTDFLTTMNSRRMYMEQPRRQTILVEKSEIIVAGIASIPGLQIVEIKMPAPGVKSNEQIGLVADTDSEKKKAVIGKDRAADLWVSIAAQKSGDVAIIQAKEIMTEITKNTGMSLRLTHQGWREDGKRRIFNIEGFIHD